MSTHGRNVFQHLIPKKLDGTTGEVTQPWGDSFLEVTALASPETTAALFAVAAWKAEQIRTSKNIYLGAIMKLSSLADSFVQDAWEWPCFKHTKPDNHRVWFAWCEKNEVKSGQTWVGGSFYLSSTRLKQIKNTRCISHRSSYFQPLFIEQEV